MSGDDLRTVLQVGEGLRWVALEGETQAEFATRASQTGIARSIAHDRASGALGTRSRYYGLTEASGKPHTMPVCLVVSSEPGVRPVVTGRINADPFRAYAGEIERLGAHLGVKLDEGCYPGRRTRH